MQLKSLHNNIYIALILRLLVIMFIFSLCRAVFYQANTASFGSISFSKLLLIMAGGLKFDISALLYVNILFILTQVIPFKFRYNPAYQKVCAYIFFIFNGLAILLNVIDIAYYPFTLKRTSFTVFSQFSHEQNGLKLFFAFLIDYWYLFIFYIGLLGFMIWAYSKIKLQKTILRNNFIYYPLALAMMLLVSYFSIAGMRGGFKHSTRPITLSNAGEFVDDPGEISIVINTPFAMIRTIKTIVLKKVSYFAHQDQLNAIYNPIKTPKDSLAFTPKNIVVLILESFSKEYLGGFNTDLDDGKYKGYTPFLDSLMTKSLVFQNAYANGRKSIEGLPSVIASIPGIQEPFVLSNYSGNRINSFGSLLTSKGYHTSFFHGAPNGSMGFSSFVKIAGIANYYGMNEYNKDEDFDGMWGIWDEPFMQYWAKTINTFKQPFYSALFSVSSHHPFKIPEKYEGEFPKGTLPVHQGIGYTDYSLKQFFKAASAMPWYKNTIFVITADHSSVAWHQEYKTTLGSYAIPIIIFDPSGGIKAGTENQPVQQIDILPGILNHLHFDKPYFAFGNDLLNKTDNDAVIHFTGDSYQIIMGDYMMRYDGEKITGVYNYSRDRFLKTNLRGKNLSLEKKMEDKFKAFLQHHNNNMINNTMTVK